MVNRISDSSTQMLKDDDLNKRLSVTQSILENLKDDDSKTKSTKRREEYINSAE